MKLSRCYACCCVVFPMAIHVTDSTRLEYSTRIGMVPEVIEGRNVPPGSLPPPSMGFFSLDAPALIVRLPYSSNVQEF